jgi:hypothetical protein
MPVETTVVAAGAWSHRLASKLGHKVPLETQRGYHALLADPNMAHVGMYSGESASPLPRRWKRACGSPARSRSRGWMHRRTIGVPITFSSRHARCFLVSQEAGPIAGWATARVFPIPCLILPLDIYSI